jgi:hypothetical protein
VSIVEGLKKELAGDTIEYKRGTNFLSDETWPVPNNLLTTDGKPGAKVTFFSENIVGFSNKQGSHGSGLATRVEPEIDATALALPDAAAGVEPLTVRW